MDNSALMSVLSVTGQSLQPLAIRKYQKYLKRPGVVSFAGGWPSAEMFPIEPVQKIAEHVITNEGSTALQYTSTVGHDRLREVLAERMTQRFEIPISTERVSIISGGQQGVFLSAMVLVDRGGCVAVEAPTFSGGLSAFQAMGATFLEIPMDDDGLDVDYLENELRSGASIKMLYTIPDFQNPSGRMLSLERRQKLVELAYEFDFFILEDAPYAELLYEGEPLPPILAFDERGERVIYLGSFSKTFAPLRLGWMVAPPLIHQQTVLAKQSMDLCCPSLTQSIAYYFVKEGHQQRHIQALVDYYGNKRNVMLAGLDRHMPAEVEWTAPKGGMFVWVTLPDGQDTDEFFFKALDHHVAFVPGSAFYVADRPTSHFRLNFVTADADQIAAGMARLGEAVRGALG